MPPGAPEPPVAQLRPGRGRPDDLPGTGRLHSPGLVPVQGRACQGGADLELRRGPRLRPPRGGAGPELAARPRDPGHTPTRGTFHLNLGPMLTHRTVSWRRWHAASSA